MLVVTNNIKETIDLGDRIISLKGKMPGTMHKTYEINPPRPREHTEMKFLEFRHEITEASELVL